MSLDFLNNLKENLEKKDTLSKITNGIADFIGELSEALQKENGNNNVDIVTQIASNNKLTMASETSIIKARNEALTEYSKNTTEEGALYFVLDKVQGKDTYKIWKFNNGKRTQSEMSKADLPEDASVNSVLRMENNNLVTDNEATATIINEIKEKANQIITEQNKKIEDYKKEGHTYLVTEDTNGRVFLWDSTEKPKNEIEDVYFSEELKDKAKEGRSFLYQNGNYVYIG